MDKEKKTIYSLSTLPSFISRKRVSGGDKRRVSDGQRIYGEEDMSMVRENEAKTTDDRDRGNERWSVTIERVSERPGNKDSGRPEEM